MNQVRSLLSMRFTLLGYSFQPRPNRPCACVYSGCSDNHHFINKRMLTLEKTSLTRENKIDKSRRAGA